MEYWGIFRPQAVTLATLTLLSLALPLSSSAQISASGDTDPGSADPFWSTGGNTSTDATVGVTGVGSVTVENGSVLSVDSGTLGRDAGSDGTITVTGDNGSGTASRLNAPNSLTIGEHGKGTLNIENGGLVTPDEVFIGTETGSVGLVTVTGVGSSLLSSDDLGVGGLGTGTLKVESGGTVSVDLAFIGAGTGGASGTVNVTGTGSSLNVSNGGILGFSNVGELNISNGGVTNFGGDLRLGQSATGDGRLIVDGTDSTYLGSGTQVTIGEEGAGTMTVRNGGEVAVDSIFVGNVAGSSGTLNVDGTGSVVTTAQGVSVAISGNAVVNVTNGGLMAFSGPEPGFGIAENTGSTGSVTIDGAGSEIRSGAFQIGESGQATVTVSNGGKLSAGGGIGPGEIVLATEAGGSGTLNVGSGGAAGIINAPKVSGRAGTSTLNFNHNEADYQFTNDGTSGGTDVLLEGQLTVRHSGTGTTTVAGNNTYTEGTSIEDGTLKLGSSTAAGTGTILIDGGTLDINGQTVSNNVSFGTSGGVLKGSGTVNASVSLNSTDNVLAPGDSPGITLYGANQTWESFTYLWELNNWEDQVAGTNFDQLQIAGSLSLTGSAIDNYNLDITSLTAADELGNLPNFSEIDQSWIIITTTGGITGFNADYWSILTSEFNTDPNAFGFFSLDVVGNDLVLTYTVPEPTTGALLLAGLAYVAIRRRR